MRIKVQAHAAYHTRYHIVWILKYRRSVFVAGVQEYLTKTLQTSIIDHYPDVYLLELNIQEDHVHLLIEIPPKYAVSIVVGTLKGVTSKLMREHFEYLRRAPALWSVGFFVSTVGINESIIRRYIQYQQKQERGQAELV